MLPRHVRSPLSAFPSFRALLALAALSPAVACSSTSSSSGTIDPAALPVLVITSPASGACVDVPQDRDADILVGVSLEPREGETSYTFTLAAPGTCGATSACGYVLLSVRDADGKYKPNNAGITDTIAVVSTAAAPLSGEIEVQAKLVADDGSAMLDAESKEITATVTLTAKASCGGGTGGSGGATTSSGSGGSGGTTTSSGTGGSGGTGGTSTSSGTGGTGGASTSSSTGGTGGGGGASTSSSTGGTGGATTSTGAGGTTTSTGTGT